MQEKLDEGTTLDVVRDTRFPQAYSLNIRNYNTLQPTKTFTGESLVHTIKLAWEQEQHGYCLTGKCGICDRCRYPAEMKHA